MNLRSLLIPAAAAALLAGGAWLFLAPGPGGPAETGPVTVPDLSAAAQAGERVFAETCAECHGKNAAGGPGGPPLVHRIYEPGHHGDMSFQLAARQGVRAHHWNFGDMPPVEGVTQSQVADIVTYVRELQRANGIR